jgi:4-hydroxybenzoate polyprenyltransferase
MRHLRTLLILGRVSNLPTVWSNCLTAWLLNGGQSWNNFHVLVVGATLLYIGGMFLNDAFDAGFDRQFRQERPIPSGQISVRAVWLIGSTLLLLGESLLCLLGLSVALPALTLVGVIVLYDAVHKRTTFAPLLMAACRFLLYVVAASATMRAVNNTIIWHGLALAAYITGLSFLARGESGSGIIRRWPLLLLFAPLVVIAMINSYRNMFSWMASVALLTWLIWNLRGVTRPTFNVGKSVAGLLAGIVLVDWAAAPRMADEFNLAFAGLFVLALILQRKIPAT